MAKWGDNRGTRHLHFGEGRSGYGGERIRRAGTERGRGKETNCKVIGEVYGKIC